MSQKDTKFTYYSGRSADLAKANYSYSGSSSGNKTVLVDIDLGDPATQSPIRRPSPAAANHRDVTNHVTSGVERTGSVTSRRVESGPPSPGDAALSWSSDAYSVASLAETFSGQFPVIAGVQRGYWSGSTAGHACELELKTGQVTMTTQLFFIAYSCIDSYN